MTLKGLAPGGKDANAFVAKTTDGPSDEKSLQLP